MKHRPRIPKPVPPYFAAVRERAKTMPRCECGKLLDKRGRCWNPACKGA